MTIATMMAIASSLMNAEYTVDASNHSADTRA